MSMSLELQFVRAGLLSERQLQVALKESENTKEPLIKVLVSQGYIKQQTVDYFLNNLQLFDGERAHYPSNRTERKISLPSWYIEPRTISKVLSIAILILLLLSIGEKLAIAQINQLTASEFTTRFFGFDEEANFPTLYSVITLGICSSLLAIISAIAKRSTPKSAKYWQALSLIFIFLAVDEACSIHEILIPLIKIVVDTKGFLYFPWVIPAVILVAIFLVIFRNFIFHLPQRTRTLFLLAGGLYVGGALGMEIIGGYLADVAGLETTVYWFVATIEELLEMFGILIFIHSLILYVRSYSSEINFSLKIANKRRYL